MRMAESPYQLYLRRLKKEAKERRKDRPSIVDPETGEIPFGTIEDDLRALGLA